MGILRNKLANNFVQIPTDIFSSDLSHGAVRVYCYLATKPDGWKVRNSDIKKNCKISDNHTIAKYLKQLVELNWITRERAVNDKNQFDGTYDYELVINPNTVKSPSGEVSQVGKTPKHSNTKTTTNIKKESNINCDTAKTIIDYLNKKSGYNYKHVDSHIKHINARVEEGHILQDFIHVIDAKVEEWEGTKFEKFLRPATLFNNEKFNQYVGQLAKDKIDDYSWANGGRVSDNTNVIEGEFSNGR